MSFLNPNDPNKPKPGFTFGQSSAFGSTTNPPTPGQTTTPQQQQQQQQQQQPQQSAFGLLNTPAGNPSTGGGAFGQQQQISGFGQPSGFGTQPSGNAFGAQTGGTASAPAPSGGGFGTSGTTNKPSLFGTGITNPPSAFGGSALGGTTLLEGVNIAGTNSGTSTPAPQTTFASFGSNPAFATGTSTPSSAPASTTSFGFGSGAAGSTAAPAANQTGFGFGGGPSTTSTSGFGSGAAGSTAAPAANQTGFGFGGAPSTTSTTTGFGQTEIKPSEMKPGFGFGMTTTQSTEQKSALGGFGQPQPQQLQQQATTTEQRPTFGGLGQTASTDKPQNAPTFSGFGQSSTTTTTTTAPAQPTESKLAFGRFGQPTQSTTTEKPAESKSTFSGFGQTSTTTTERPTSTFSGFGQTSTPTTEKPTPGFGGFGQTHQPSATTTEKPALTFGSFGQQQQRQQQQTTPSDKPVESKPTFGGLSTATKPSPWQTPSSTTTKPTDTKPFNFPSAPASASTTPKIPEPQATSTGFQGFKLNASTAPSKDQSAPTLAVPKPLGGFGDLTGFSTPGTSTAATSVSGDSTSTTPAPIKKDFAPFGGVTPTGTPGPGEKQDETKGFRFDKEKDAEGEKKTGFAGFMKKDESEGKKDEKPVGLGIGEKVGEKPAVTEVKGDVVQGMKNKTMEEIINKWTGELDRCAEQFKTQSNDIRRWDAILVENGDKIAKLYTATLEATQVQDHIDTVLTYIEDSQTELSLLLDHYEKVARDYFDQLGGRESMQPVDQEREQMYTLAESVNAELDECVKSLGGMIEEINNSSTSRATGSGDLLGDVVKVLNEQLVSLGWIEEVTSKVEERVGKLEREAKILGEGFA